MPPSAHHPRAPVAVVALQLWVLSITEYHLLTFFQTRENLRAHPVANTDTDCALFYLTPPAQHAHGGDARCTSSGRSGALRTGCFAPVPSIIRRGPRLAAGAITFSLACRLLKVQRCHRNL